MEEGRNPIIIRDFVRSNVECWGQEAQNHWDNEQPIQAFICAWIAFNYYYALFWTNLRRQLGREGKRIRFPYLFGHGYHKDIAGYVQDQVPIATFINRGSHNPAFDSFWKSFVALKADSLVHRIELPITHLATDESVPDSKPREVRLIDLEIEPLFRVLVTIRNNLFHGGKRFTGRRDVEVCRCAAEFMVPFVTELIENIEE